MTYHNEMAGAATPASEYVLAMPAVARELLGEPNRHHSKPDDLRYGNNGSVSIDVQRGRWFDHEQNIGGGVLDLILREQGGTKAEARNWLKQRGHLTDDKPRQYRRIVQAYRYTDEAGNLLFEACRMEPKSFRQRQPDGRGGWNWSVKGVRQVPYRLPELVNAKDGATVYIVEGEKDADRLAGIGLTATTNAGGAGKWRAEFADHFPGKRVAILPDNDTAGRDHARKVLTSLRTKGIDVKIIDLPDLPDKGDVSDWIDKGGNVEALQRLYDEAQDQPKTVAGVIPDLTEDGVALSFTDRHGGKLRFDHDQGRWFMWRGDRWKPDNTHLAYSYCREIARELSERLKEPQRVPFRKAAFAAGVERMARSDRAHAVTSEGWDNDPYLLGCPGVTVDLRTGQHLPPDPAHGITKQAAVRPEEGACDLWMNFLHEVCENDTSMVRFLQQWCGYCLTGDTREHALLFVYGPGGNGKSVFLETVAHILADYATTSSMDTFTASKGDRHPTDLAMLRGARMVSASETEEGRAWAESRIKQLTGGDQITARFMRQDFFTYTPHFKLTVVGNHKPVLSNVDDAARRRFNIVPFTVKPKNPDRVLTTKLRAEAPEILQWMIDGCMDWHENGLIRPQRVLAATAEYFEDQDLFGQWLDEWCRVEPENRHLSAGPKDLFEAWSKYAQAAGEQPGTQRGLSNALSKRGLARDVRKIGGKAQRLWCGIEIHRPDVNGWQDQH